MAGGTPCQLGVSPRSTSFLSPTISCCFEDSTRSLSRIHKASTSSSDPTSRRPRPRAPPHQLSDPPHSSSPDPSSMAPTKVAVVGFGMSATVFHIPFSQPRFRLSLFLLHPTQSSPDLLSSPQSSRSRTSSNSRSSSNALPLRTRARPATSTRTSASPSSTRSSRPSPRTSTPCGCSLPTPSTLPTASRPSRPASTSSLRSRSRPPRKSVRARPHRTREGPGPRRIPEPPVGRRLPDAQGLARQGRVWRAERVRVEL